MNGAEFDTYRIYLGLSLEEAAKICGVSDRSIRRWIAGKHPVPQSAFEAMAHLEARMCTAVELILNYTDKDEAEKPLVIKRSLSRIEQDYIPAGALAMCAARLYADLKAEGRQVIVEWEK